MDNKMDINLRDDNSMESLAFYWKAFFSDGRIIEQFNKDGTENNFQLVKNSFDKLIRFFLVSKDSSQNFIVDLQNGFIIYNNYKNINLEIKEKKDNIRLIYFRRIKIEINEQDLKEKSRTITYFLGFQWNDKLKNNRQIILEIDEKGNFIIKGE